MILCANPSAQFISYQEEIESAVLRVMRGNSYILGSEVATLESEFAQYIGVRSAIGVANGTDALEIAMRALDIGPGDEVITVTHTAVATVAAIESVGATAVLVDVDPVYYTLNPKQLNDVLTPRTKAIIAVHLYGQSADLDAISRFCAKYNLFLIEDVSQAHGAKWKGRQLGSVGDISCFSCYPTKNLGAIGDAGLVATNNEELGNKVRMLREYGWKRRYISDFAGRNSRLDELQAAVLRIKLRYLDADNKKRKKIANFYLDGFKSTNNLVLPSIREGSEHVFHLFVVKTSQRNELKDFLEKQGIQVGIHYPIPIHLQPAYENRIRIADNLEVSEALAHEVISLPIYPELPLSDIQFVVDSVNSFLSK